ncbi:MAG: M48 family peptidase [Candidatus Acidiferrales bacterium]
MSNSAITKRPRSAIRRSSATVPGGALAFQRMFTRLGCQGRPPQFSVEFYPYANLSHTIRLREGTIAIARLSDVLRGAPLRVIEATAAVLLGRLYRKRVPHELLDRYRHFSAAPATERRIRRLRQNRARRPTLPARGDTHDLAPLFTELNQRYFEGRLHRPGLAWSKRVWRRQLGCFDPGLDLIVINARLDRPGTPRYVVESILFHEMLHVKHPLRVARCGLEIHSVDFRREEKRFQHYERARRYLKRMR